MSSRRFEMRLPEGLAAELDRVRGVTPLAAVMRQAAEEWLVARRGEPEAAAGPRGVVSSVPAVSSAVPGPQFNRVSSLGGAARPIPRRS